jgi:hypothetical protein
MVTRTPGQPLEAKVREETAGFVRRIGALSDEPGARSALLRHTVHEVAAHLLAEFGDHYALAQQLEIAGRLAWCGPDAVRAATHGKPPAALPANRGARPRREAGSS